MAPAHQRLGRLRPFGRANRSPTVRIEHVTIDPFESPWRPESGETAPKVPGRGDERWVTILGPWESKPEKDVFSNESELAQSLLGSKVGDEVQIGENDYRVEAIKPYA